MKASDAVLEEIILARLREGENAIRSELCCNGEEKEQLRNDFTKAEAALSELVRRAAHRDA